MAYPLRFVSGFVGALVCSLPLAACQRLPGEELPGDDDDDEPTDDGNAEDTFGDDSGSLDDGPTTELDCDPVEQTGCPADQKCAATKTGADVIYTCVSDETMYETFDACTPALASGLDGCAAGTVCLGDASGNGVCVPMCLRSGDCEDARCIPDALEGIKYCAPECSPFEAMCSGALQCRRDQDAFLCKFPQESDVGGYRDPCALENDTGCSAGLVCLPGSLVPECTEPNCCTTVCDLSGSDSCSSPATCTPLSSTPTPGFEDIGACFVPT